MVEGHFTLPLANHNLNIYIRNVPPLLDCLGMKCISPEIKVPYVTNSNSQNNLSINMDAYYMDNPGGYWNNKIFPRLYEHLTSVAIIYGFILSG